MDLYWQEHRKTREPGGLAKAAGGRVRVLLGVGVKAFRTLLKRKMGKDDFKKLCYTL